MILKGATFETRKVDERDVVMNASVERKTGTSKVVDVEKFSNLEKLLIMTAYVVRLVNN